MKFLLSCIFTICYFALSSQYYYRGQNPSSTKWRQINTEHFQLIYPEDFEVKAQYTANILSLVYEKASKTLVVAPRKISILLQNDLVEANGFVTLAPWRSEFFTTPPQDDEGLEWLHLLAIHEYRHVVQISKFNQGLTRLMYWLLGEQGIGLVFGATTPLWFMEGDAVGFETFATGYGRGRLPSFSMESRAMLLQLGQFNYEKASFGSFKDYVPGRYPFGYHMTSYVKEKYGTNTWDRVINRVARFPLRPYPFSSSLHHVTGKGTSAMYKEMAQYQREKWSSQMKVNEPYYTDFTIINDTVRRGFTSYTFPIANEKGVLAVKKGLSDVPQLVLIGNDKKERELMKFGSHDGVSLHANNNYVVWVEEFPDARWEYRTYSDIVMYDLEKNKRVRLTKKQRLFAPNISSDNQIVAVAVSKSNVSSLVFLDADKGNVYKTREFPEYDMLYFPVWGPNNYILFVAKKDGLQHIIKWNTATDVIEVLADDLPFVVSHLNFRSRKLYFHSTQMGIDNIFQMDLATKKTYQVTVSKFGAFNPYVSPDGRILYNDYSAKGMNVAQTSLSEEFESLRPMFVSQGLMLYNSALQNEEKIVVNKDEFKKFESKKYHPGFHLFNIHSWGPVNIDAQSNEASLGFAVLSQDKLSTSVTSYNFNYNPQQNQLTHDIKYKYMGFYPKLSVGAIREFRDVLLPDDSTVGRLQTDRLNGEVELDLNLTKGYFQTFAGVSFRYTFINFNRSDDYSGRLDVGDIIPYFSCMARTSKRDLFPRWGVYSTFLYRLPLVEKSFSSKTAYALATFYLPGVAKHHGIQLKTEWQQSKAVGFYPSNNIDLPRGYINSNQQYTYTSMLSGKVDYNFPLFYPDWKFGPIAYLQRLKMGLHYDYARMVDLSGTFHTLQSFGAELRGDVNFFRYDYPVDIGVRASFTEANAFALNKPYLQFLFGVDFY
ncbi:MAG: TolB family protein [Flavobacteriales bacterium]